MRRHNAYQAAHTAGGLLLVLLLAPGMLGADQGQGAAESDQVRSTLDTLEGWLSTSQEGPGWSAYLQNDALREQLQRGDKADVARVSAILAQYTSGAAGLEAGRFVAVRNALQGWCDQLAGVSEANLLAATRAAADRFTRPDPRQLAADKRAVRTALARLDAYLRRSPARARAWKAYLDWQVIGQQLAAHEPDLKQLESVIQRLSGPDEGLGLAQFKQLRGALRTYVDRQFAADHPEKVKSRLGQIADELAGSIQQLTDESTQRQALAVGGRLDFLERYTEVAALGRLIRQRYSHPNLAAYASDDLLKGAVERAIHEPTQIRDNILGTRVSGTGLTEGEVELTLVPNPQRAEFDISMEGVNRAETVGRVRKVRIHSRSTTQLKAETRIAFAPEAGLSATPTSTWAEAQTEIDNITVDSRLERMITRIAWKKAGQQKPAAEQEAGRKAQQRLRHQFDRQIADMIDQTNGKYHDKFRRPLVRQDLFPERFEISSSEEAIQLVVLKAFADQLAAPGATAPPPPGHDAALVVHESLINNVAAHLLGGRKFTNQDADQASDSDQMENVRKFVKVHNVGEAPEDKKDAPWEITLASANPVTIAFREGKIKITVRGTRFLGIDEQEYKRPMSVWTEFAVAHGKDGSLWLNLQGWDVEATAVETGGKFQPADAPLRSKLRARLKDVLGPQEAEQKLAIEFLPIEPEGEAARVGKLVYTRCEPAKAWLALAIDRAQKVGSLPDRDAPRVSAVTAADLRD